MYPFRVLNPHDHPRVSEEVRLHFFGVRLRNLHGRVSDVGQEIRTVAGFAIPLGIDEAAGTGRVQRGSFRIQLALFPRRSSAMSLLSPGSVGCADAVCS